MYLLVKLTFQQIIFVITRISNRC